MQQEEAQRLFFSGAFLVILDAPKSLNFTIDTTTWVIGDAFRGIKMIPPGIHMIGICTADQTGTGPRQSFFREFRGGQTVCFQFDKQTEEMHELPEQARSTIQKSVIELDPFLGPYPVESLNQWTCLSDRLSLETIKSAIPLLSFDQMTSSYLGAVDINRLANISLASSPDSFSFTTIDLKRSFPEAATGRERTLMSLEKSYLLESILEEISDDRLLGELQLSFLIVVLGQNFEGFEQWKRIIELASKSKQSVEKRPLFFRDLLKILSKQLLNCPSNFFTDLLDSTSNIASYFQDLYLSCMNSSNKDLLAAANSFAQQTKATFGWDLSDLNNLIDDDDEKPVVVEL